MLPSQRGLLGRVPENSFPISLKKFLIIYYHLGRFIALSYFPCPLQGEQNLVCPFFATARSEGSPGTLAQLSNHSLKEGPVPGGEGGVDGPRATLQPGRMMPVNRWVRTPAHLGEPGADGGPVAIVDVHGPRVLVLQGRPHDHVVEAVHVDVREGGDGGAEPCVLRALGAFQKLVPVQHALERGEGEEREPAASHLQLTASDGHPHRRAGPWGGLETQHSKPSRCGENCK